MQCVCVCVCVQLLTEDAIAETEGQVSYDWTQRMTPE